MMRFKIMAGLVVMAMCISPTWPIASSTTQPNDCLTPKVYFSPLGGCTTAVVGKINIASKTISVMAYTFTSTPIAQALGQAQERGVKVRVVLDKKETGSKYSVATYLAHHGVAVWLDSEHPIMHDKVMVIDGATVVTGSFNFTKQAEEKNAENLLMIQDEGLAGQYERNFQSHLSHSTAVKP